MNKERRVRVSICISDLEKIKQNLESVMDDETEAFENMPEGLQCSMRGQDSEEAIDLLEESVEAIDDIINELHGIS